MPEARGDDVERPEGEDHREGPPGYDLDEQQAIEDLQRRGDAEAGDGEEGAAEAPDAGE